MADVKIFNLDAVIAEQPQAKILWQGQEHEVIGLTPETWLRAQKLQQVGENATAAEQFLGNLALLTAVCPGLEAHEADLRRLKLPVLQKLVEFVLEEAGFGAGSTAAAEAEADAQESESGELTPPA